MTPDREAILREYAQRTMETVGDLDWPRLMRELFAEIDRLRTARPPSRTDTMIHPQDQADVPELGAEVDRVNDMLEQAGLRSHLLTRWEKDFCESLAYDVDHFRESTKMSANRWRSFQRIEHKLAKSE